MPTLHFPAPARSWSTNDEKRFRHWSQRHRLTKAWRETAFWEGAQAHLHNQPPSTIRVVLPFPRGGRRDPSNYVGTVVKAIVDGLVDARVWPDDTPDYVTILEPALVVDKEADVYVVIEART